MAQALTLAAPITRVEIFRDSALVHRRAPLEPFPGPERRLRIAGLPLSLRESSLRVALEPAGGARLAGIRLGLEIEAPSPEEKVEEVEAIRALRQQIALLQARRDQLLKNAQAIQALQPDLPPYPQDPDKPRFAVPDPTPGWLACGEFALEQGRRCLGEAAGLEPQLRELGEQLRVAEERVAGLSRQHLQKLRLHRELALVLSGVGPKPAAILISYQIPGACWYPAYEIRVADSGESAEICLSALVAQATGEDWDGVELHLSTANLARNNDLPELGARRIGRVQAEGGKSAWRPLPGDLSGLFLDFDRHRPSLPGIIPAPDDLAALARPESAPTAPPPASESPVPEAALPTDLIDPSPAADFELEELREVAEEAFIDEELDRAFGAAPPLPPPCVAPAPAAAVMAPAPMQARTAKAEGAILAAKERARGTAVGGRREARPALPPELAPEAGLLDYESLLLPSAEASGRGTLRSRQAFEQLPPDWRQSPLASRLLEAELQRLAQLMIQLKNIRPPQFACPIGESAGHFAYVYRTSLARAIPADGQLHRIPVLQGALPLELFYRTLPLADLAAYRGADIQNSLDLPLLAGPIDVYWGADYLVTGRLATTAPKARLALHLGVEPSLKVARNVRHKESQSGLIGQQTLYEDEIGIEVESHLPKPVRLEVIERLPVTDDERLKISLKEISPPAEEYKQAERGSPVEGGRRWRLEIQPGQKERCLLRYQLELPGKTEIVGGGRRA